MDAVSPAYLETLAARLAADRAAHLAQIEADKIEGAGLAVDWLRSASFVDIERVLKVPLIGAVRYPASVTTDALKGAGVIGVDDWSATKIDAFLERARAIWGRVAPEVMAG